jgi:hypothetical protein
MALDPISAGINLAGLFAQIDAGKKAADAANNNRLQQLAIGNQNLQLQGINTENMLGINDQLMQAIKDYAAKTGTTVSDIVTNMSDLVNRTTGEQTGQARSNADQRNALARALAERDVTQATGSTGALTRAATADRNDAFGNTTYYDPRTGGFNTSLSMPATDISRHYTQAEDARLQGLQDALAKQRFGSVPSEAAIRAELTGLMSDANAQKMKDIQNAIGLSAIRSNRGGDYATLVKSINDQLGQQLPQTLLDARNQAVQEYLARVNAKTNTSNADIAALKDPYATPAILNSANNDRNAAIANLTDTLKTNAGIGERAVNTSAGRLTDAQNQGFADVLGAVTDTGKQKVATSAANNALTLNTGSNAIQQLIDALTQRENIWAGNAARTQGVISTAAGLANSASAQNVSAIGKQAPNATILGNLADNFSLTDDSGSKSKKGASTDDLVQSIMDKINAG